MSVLPIQPASHPLFCPSMVTGLTGEEYRARVGITQSDLNRFAESPALWKLVKEPASKAMQFGTILHGMVLEGIAAYHVKPAAYGPDAKPWNGNANECKAWLATHTDLPVLSMDEADAIKSASAAVRSHETCAHWLQQGHAEVSVFARWGKGRFDYVADRGDYIDIIDLKTCQDARHRKFQSTIVERGYHIQAAWYRRLLREFTDLPLRYRFIALELQPIPRINCFTLTESAIDQGDERIDWLLERMDECREKNRWPDFHAHDMGETGDIDLPEWAYPDEIEITPTT